MDKIKVEKALDLGNDVLEVSGTVDGVPATARGWLSAMDHHFDEHHYVDVPSAKDGEKPHAVEGRHRKPDAKPRKMKDHERLAYMQRLLLEAAQKAPDAPKEIPVPGAQG